MTRALSMSVLAGAVLFVLFASGCIRFYFWAGEHELTVPPEPAAEPTPEPTPEEAAPLRG